MPVQPTSYTYDALGNLTQVQQGMQTRAFAYSSLSRLTSATNPESGTVSYTYDPNGNPYRRTDARGVTTTHEYDELNRVKRTTHSDGTHETGRYYDTEPGARGLLWRTGRAGDYTDLLERDAAGRPRRNRQWFYAAGVWRYYDTTYQYDLAGNVKRQTYPSGRVVDWQYDGAGRLKRMTGNLGDGLTRTYSTGYNESGVETGIQYDAASRLTREAFGTQTLLHLKRHYNTRGQLFDVRVGSALDEWSWNRGAVVMYYDAAHTWAGQNGNHATNADNNGNVTRMQSWVPGNDAVTTYALSDQYFQYDTLNRLTAVNEYKEGTGVPRQHAFAQVFSYDRWGNRQIDAGQTTDGLNERQFSISTGSNRLGVPAGQPGVMTYDAAGNLITDTYSAAAATRSFDADNRMTRETNTAGLVTGLYSYDGDGRRVRRTAAGQEWWYLYGPGGELLAEYGAHFNGSAPQQEYGYRRSELLISASSYGAQGLQADFYNSLDFTNGALTRTDATVNFEWHGASPGPGVGADNFTARWTGYVTPRYSETYTFYTQTDDGVRLWVNGQLIIDKWIDQGWTQWSGQITLQAGRKYSIRMDFYERGGGAIAKLLWSSASQWYEVIPQSQLTPPQGAPVKWLVTDHLGTPRMVIDQTGSLAGVSRHDYLPFGEEIGAGVGIRTTGQGYSQFDGVRQGFTGKERDIETGLDFFNNRFNSSAQGRFISVDPLRASARVSNPQSFNRYTYVLNRPTVAIDPDGLSTIIVTVKPPSERPTASVRLVRTRGATAGTIPGASRDNPGTYNALATGQGRDRATTSNDTPFGVYRRRTTATAGGNATSRISPAYGTGQVLMDPVAGEVVAAGRSGILLHGGGSGISARDGGPYALLQPLTPTEGCVRMCNGHVNQLIQDVNSLEGTDDALDRIFIGDQEYLNNLAGQTDADGNYLYPDLRIGLGLFSSSQELEALVQQDLLRLQVEAERRRIQEEERRRRRDRRRAR